MTDVIHSTMVILHWGSQFLSQTGYIVLKYTDLSIQRHRPKNAKMDWGKSQYNTTSHNKGSDRESRKHLTNTFLLLNIPKKL